jgi:hypothetical protein
MLKDKLNLKLVSEKEQVQKEGGFNLPLNMCLETQEGFLCSVFLFNL